MEKRVRRAPNVSEHKILHKGDRVSEDFISELPDEILVCILSRLSLKEAVATSVLSRRWKYLWASITKLDFDPRKTPYNVTLSHGADWPELMKIERPRYANWVNRVLGQHRGPNIDEFRVWFDLDNSSMEDINRWIKFAMQKRVQRFEMHLAGFRMFTSVSSRYDTFPYQLLLCPQIGGPSQTQLCSDIPRHIHSSTFVGFKSLKDLTLREVNVSWKVLEYFLANCPNLERLVVHRSEHLKKLIVVGSSLSLKHLEISFCSRLKSIKICDTNLVSFKYAGPGRRLLCNNVPMLIDVSISEGMYSNLMFRQLSSCLSQLQILTLSKEIVQDKINLRLFKGVKNLKKLVLEFDADDEESFLVLTPLIKACPYLQKFVFKLLWINHVKRKRRFIEVVKCPHHYLKVVEIGGYYGGSSDFELVMYFIENATILEKIIIDPRYQYCWDDFAIGVYNKKEQEQSRRRLAELQLEGKVPPRIKLEIL